MNIEVFTGGPFDTNTYLLINEQHEALVIDPTFESFDYLSYEIKEKNLNLLGILITHSHFDHIIDVAAFKKEFGSKIYIHPLDQGNLIHPGSDRLPCLETIKGVKPDHLVEDGMVIQISDFKCLVLHTPGHSFGSVCFYFKDEAKLFSGDTLFRGTYGNISFPTSEPLKMKASLKKLSMLPKETSVFPGHGDPTTIEQETWLNQLDEYFKN
ncbi:MAG: MBL fold metallo-hydrolase [Chlamydiae bacterium]|nr:MBL fold metallo-hydrolase [Chlamydiota bacterium]